MPRMDWEEFQRDHHRPHLLVVSTETTKAPKPPAEKADFERLAVRLGAAGNYAFKVEGATVYAAFEADADAKRFAEVFRAGRLTRESQWASKALARIDGATYRRIAGILIPVRLTTKTRKFTSG